MATQGSSGGRETALTGRLLVVVLAATLAAIGLSGFGALDAFTGWTADRLVQARNGGKAPPSSVVLVDVDARTVQSKRGRLPLDRTVYADAIAELTRLGAQVIAIDVQFTEASNPDSDEALLTAMENSDVPIVLATSEVKPGADTDVFGGRANLGPAGAVAAHSSQLTDPDHHIRRLGRSVAGLTTFAQATARAAGRPGLPHDRVLLDPTVPANKLDRVSMTNLVSGDADASLVRGRVAVIGVTVISASGRDEQIVAGSSRRVYGVEFQAQAIDTALRGEPLKDAGRVIAYLVAFLASAFAALGARRSLIVQIGAAVGTAVVLTVGAWVAVKAGVLIDPVPAVVALVLAATGAAAVRSARDRRRRAEARATLSRFVPPGVVDDLLENHTDGLIAPRGQEASVLFCDLRGYTALVSSLPRPDLLLAVLDAYLGAVTEIVHAHGGTVVSFQGDGVMSAFGTPVPSADSAARAVAAARDLQGKALPQLRAALRDELPGADDLNLGVGVSTGPVFAGTVGPPERREYAVVGPTTNLAARLQALTKTEHVGIVMDNATAMGAGAGELRGAHTGIDLSGALRSLGRREIRGLAAPIEVWTTEAGGGESPAREDA